MCGSQKGDLNKFTEEVFNLLKQKGPLCPCQISVELFMPSTTVMDTLRKLRELGLVEVRPDRNEARDYGEFETAWGLHVKVSKGESATRKFHQSTKV